MAISSELFMAILSMDSYNRGYGSGTGSLADGLGSLEGMRIGDATIYRYTSALFVSDALVDAFTARKSSFSNVEKAGGQKLFGSDERFVVRC